MYELEYKLKYTVILSTELTILLYDPLVFIP